MKSILLFIFLSHCLHQAECVKCFQSVDLSSGQCKDEIGEVEIDDCCQNAAYGYHDNHGACHYCGRMVLSEWSTWGQCSNLCGVGGRSRSRKCLGVGSESSRSDPNSPCHIQNIFQTEPCTSNTCCSAVQWSEWSSWSSCSVSCGGKGGGVQQRKRACPSQEEGCVNTCPGENSQSQACIVDTPCPVHGSWGVWGEWSQCSAACVSGSEGDAFGAVYPTRSRERQCDSPAPSSDTVPPGNNCPGEDYDMQSCTHLPNCPVDGGWGSYGPMGVCSVSCGEGLQLSIRHCDTPTPKYGGKPCEGASTKTEVCNTPCPVHGGWTGWSSWGECSTSCIPEGRASTRTRHRSCTNPAPALGGGACTGDERETGDCNHLSHCAVNGAWGPWTPWSGCSVTCGAGVQLSDRHCDSPANRHRGMPCQGERSRTRVCTTNVHCPVHGVWSEWSTWADCMFAATQLKGCKGNPNPNPKRGGTQDRTKKCLRDHGGSPCPLDEQLQTQGCYSVAGCNLKGTWKEWADWSPCRPSCGSGHSRRHRQRICEPDYKGYGFKPTIGRTGLLAHYHGKPNNTDCGDLERDQKRDQSEDCIVPACPSN